MVTHALPPMANSVDWRWVGQSASQIVAPPTHRNEIMSAAARCRSPWGPDGLNNITMGTTPRTATIDAIMMRAKRCSWRDARYSDNQLY